MPFNRLFELQGKDKRLGLQQEETPSASNAIRPEKSATPSEEI
jgi:hypothetical protein